MQINLKIKIKGEVKRQDLRESNIVFFYFLIYSYEGNSRVIEVKSVRGDIVFLAMMVCVIDVFSLMAFSMLFSKVPSKVPEEIEAILYFVNEFFMYIDLIKRDLNFNFTTESYLSFCSALGEIFVR